eukprot:CAMPEP_0114263762 /NCGR_PEP_ID=MMETSP0058-20121206/22745_1 /TAXON_ID=36894 /ORGANISM="Pyramimonas parkeae, CCMP726" /LENGTH=348 /DNA_ID=CAMNT_0001380189 /DNA_START=151 /DNA_END=1197 /DNA_ORIENTATION=+
MATGESSSTFIHEFIFAEDSAPTPACHAATLLELGGGEVLAAWFGGGAEGSSDVAIWSAARSKRQDESAWSAPRLVAKVGEEAHWNPVLFRGHEGRIWMHFKVGNLIPLWRTYVTHSDDDGATWVTPRELVAGDEGGRGCVKNKPLVVGGDIVCGASTEEEGWNAFVDRSVDGGLTFQRTPDIAVEDGAGVIQPSLWESAPGQVHMLLRSDAGHVYRSNSADGGRTWGPANSTDLPNNNSGLDVVKLAGGVLVLAMNPVSDNWGGRWPLRLAVSHDNGNTWPEHLDIENHQGEFSYPAIIPWMNEEGFHLAYTWNRQRMRYLSLSLPELLKTCKPITPSRKLQMKVSS